MPKMPDDELVALCEAEMTRALGASGGDISEERSDAMDRYLGKEYGNEVDGRSQVRTREVADTIEWILPSLMRIFTDADNALVFEPHGPEDEDAAQQETDRVAHEVYVRNNGFMVLYSLFKDALLSKVGVAKVFWDEEEHTERETYRNLLDIELQYLLADDSMQREVLDFAQDETGISVTFATTTKRGKVRVLPVPPEEFGIDNRMTSLDPADAYFAYHQTKKTRSDLIEAGYSRKIVEDLPADDQDTDAENLARYDKSDDDYGDVHRALQTITVAECYVRADRDDDGIAELLKVTLAGGGDGRTLLDVEECDAIPFISLTPVPITHKYCGLSIADLVSDIQEIKTVLLRNMLDSMYLANNGRTAASNRVELEDLKVVRPGGIVRVDTEGPDVAGHISPVISAPIPAESFGLLEYLDGVLQQRTGVGDQVMGLDSASLSQIQTTALAQASDAARMRIELIARIFAETGVRRLFLRTHELLQKHQDKQEVVKLRNQWVQVNPSEWRTRENCKVLVGVGNASTQRRQMALQQVLQLQQVAVQAGAMGMLVTPDNIYRAAHDLMESMGIKEPALYLTDPKTQQPQQPPPDPKMIEVQMKGQIEQAKLQLEGQRIQIEQAKLQQQGQVDQLETVLKAKETELKSQIETLKANSAMQRQSIDERSQMLNASASAQKALSDAHATRLQQRIDMIEAEKDRQLEAYKAQLDATVKLQIESVKQAQAQSQMANDAAASEQQQRQGETVATLYSQIEALTESLRELEEARSQPMDVERDTDGRITKVGGRLVERDENGLVRRLH